MPLARLPDAWAALLLLPPPPPPPMPPPPPSPPPLPRPSRLPPALSTSPPFSPPQGAGGAAAHQEWRGEVPEALRSVADAVAALFACVNPPCLPHTAPLLDAAAPRLDAGRRGHQSHCTSPAEPIHGAAAGVTCVAC
eukprot:7387738-Prymnesium_polylepis.1